MGWIQSKIPNVPITNFTTDWNDGRAVGALVDAVAPGMVHIFVAKLSIIKLIWCAGLCPDWDEWDPKDALQNASEAMGLADDWLRIPQVRDLFSRKYIICFF